MENKHYIRLDSKSNIIKGFSDAFEEPLQTDILLCDGERHFEMNGMVNPQLTTFDGIYLYRYEKEIITKTEQEIESERVVPIPKPSIQEQLDSQSQAIMMLMEVLG